MRVAAPAESAAFEGVRTTLRLDAHTTAPPPVDTTPERRAALERELDRVQVAIQAEQVSYGHQLNWLMLSQALLLNAYLIVLVLGWSEPLPAKRWLLAGLALFGGAIAVMIHIALRGAREAMRAMRKQRRDLEATLAKDFNRAPVFVPLNIVSRGLGQLAGSLLPIAFIAGWVLLTLYTLGAPVISAADARVATPAQASAPAGTPIRPRPIAADAPAQPAAAPKRTGFKW